jgi:type II secretion system protein N
MARPKSSTVLICLFVFLAGVVFMFPLQNLKGLIFQKIYDNTGVLIVAEEIRPLFFGWPGIEIRNVNVTLPVGDSDLELASKTMSFRIRLSSFFIPSVSLSFDELSSGGDLFLQFGQSGNTDVAFVESDKFNLGQITIPEINQSIQGFLNSDAYLKIDNSKLSNTKGQIKLKGTNIKLPMILVNNPMLGPPFVIPELEAGDLDVLIKIQDGLVSLNNFKIGNPNTDFSGGITGEARLGESTNDTQLNLTLRFLFSPKIINNQEYRTFLDFVGAYKTVKSGEYAMNWNASLGEILNLTKALPTPVK